MAGLFYGSLQQGGYYLQLLSFNPEIIDIIIAVIIYTSALGLFLQKFVLIILRKKKESFEDDDSDDSDDKTLELATDEGSAK